LYALGGGEGSAARQIVINCGRHGTRTKRSGTNQISLMHGPAGGECLPLKSRGKSLTLDLLTVC
jgi:hypothetical protein